MARLRHIIRTRREARTAGAFLRAGLIVASLTAVATLPNGGAAAAPVARTTHTKLTKITLGVLAGSAGQLAVYVAQGQGFFKKWGLDPHLVYISDFPEIVSGVESGSLDVAGVGDIFQLYQKGVHVEALFGDNSYAGFFDMLCNHSVNATSGSITSRLEAISQSVLGFPVGSPPYYALVAALKYHHIGVSGLRTVNLGVGPPQIAAVETGKVGCSIVSPDEATLLTRQKGSGVYVPVNLGAPGVTYPVVSKAVAPWDALPSWVNSHKSTVIALERAYAEAMLWADDPANLPKVAEYMAKAEGGTAKVSLPLLEAMAKALLPELNPLWGVAGASYAYTADLRAGVLTTPIANFNPRLFVGPGSPNTMQALKALAAGKPAQKY